MSAIRKNFSCPPSLWAEFQRVYLDVDPERNLSGFIQKQMERAIHHRQTIEKECSKFENGYCTSDGSIGICSRLTIGVCLLAVKDLVQSHPEQQTH